MQLKCEQKHLARLKVKDDGKCSNGVRLKIKINGESSLFSDGRKSAKENPENGMAIPKKKHEIF
jgi:hypothetical protein